MNDPFLVEKCYLLAVDPVHVGSGSYCLGRVDNAIVREPATNLPKIPATSLGGTLRSFMAMRADKYPGCAGQGQPAEEQGGDQDQGRGSQGHCGRPDCPVCMSFGFSRRRQSFQGLVQLTDAHILFFPVYSRLGPVWVTAPVALSAAGLDGPTTVAEGAVLACDGIKSAAGDKLNLGWVLLPVEDDLFAPPQELNGAVPDRILDRCVLISDSLFSRVVNDNLEVRTSVAIDPDTGAAMEKALFTYEAIPRMTVLCFDVIVNEPSLFRVPPEGCLPEIDRDTLIDRLRSAAEYLEWLGLGGMNTRGLGRVRAVFSQAGGSRNGAF